MLHILLDTCFTSLLWSHRHNCVVVWLEMLGLKILMDKLEHLKNHLWLKR